MADAGLLVSLMIWSSAKSKTTSAWGKFFDCAKALDPTLAWPAIVAKVTPMSASRPSMARTSTSTMPRR